MLARLTSSALVRAADQGPRNRRAAVRKKRLWDGSIDPSLRLDWPGLISPSPAPTSGSSPGGTAAVPLDTRWAILLVLSVTALHVLYAGLVPLSPQEAYYWQYARHPALSYYDHPPLAAWTIWATTSLLGASERAIRAAAAFHSLVFTLFFFLSGRRLFGPRAAFLAVATALVTPLFTAAQTIITPDGPLLACWAAALYFTVRTLQSERGLWLLAAGLSVGAAGLSKYTGAFLVPIVFLTLLLDPRGRRLLLGPWPYVGLLIAGVLVTPVLIWNAHHGWISFAFQFGLRSNRVASPHLRLVGSFIGLQAAAVSPVLFLLLWAAPVQALLRRDRLDLRLCAVFSLPVILVFLAFSPFTWVKGNWAAPAYPAALLAATSLYLEGGRSYRRLSVVAFCVAALATLYVHLAPLVNLPFPPSQDSTAGWRELAARVDQERARIPGPSFVVGCFYKSASELAYYLPGRPETYSGNAFGDTGLEYDYWGDPRRLSGQDAIVVIDQRDWKYCLRRAEYCSPLEPLEPLTVRRPLPRPWSWIPMSDVVTTFKLWRCHGYRE